MRGRSAHSGTPPDALVTFIRASPTAGHPEKASSIEFRNASHRTDETCQQEPKSMLSCGDFSQPATSTTSTVGTHARHQASHEAACGIASSVIPPVMSMAQPPWRKVPPWHPQALDDGRKFGSGYIPPRPPGSAPEQRGSKVSPLRARVLPAPTRGGKRRSKDFSRLPVDAGEPLRSVHTPAGEPSFSLDMGLRPNSRGPKDLPGTSAGYYDYTYVYSGGAIGTKL